MVAEGIRPENFVVDTHTADNFISQADCQVLRRLAGRVAELASRNVEIEKKKLWAKHNNLEPCRPLIFCDPENGWNEIITPDQYECRGEFSRQLEQVLRKEIFWGESMRDDRVIEPWFNLPHVYKQTSWGLREENIGGQDGGAFTWKAPITDLNDLSKLRFQTIIADSLATEHRIALVQDVFGDLLPIRLRTAWFWSVGLTWEYIKLRGLEEFMTDMYDNPTGWRQFMSFLRDGTMHVLDQLENDGLFTLNNEGDYVGSGGFGWTNQLPAKNNNDRVRTRDLWCLSEAQEAVGVSPGMFEEFVFPYQLPLMERFGLVCYGCCEPLESKWHIIRGIKNLRRVSISPWSDRAKMADYLGSRYIYSLKPHPGPLAKAHFDPDAVRADIRDALEKTRGCHLEIVMKDNHTIQNDPSRVIKWVQTVREEIEKISSLG